MRRSRLSFVALALSASLLLLLSACTESEPPTQEPSAPSTVVDTPTEQPAPTEEPAPTTEVTPTEEPAPAPEVTPTEEPAPAATEVPEVVPTEEPEPSIGLVAFADGGRIGVARPAHLDSVFLTTGPGDFNPVWSPDGTMIAFSRFFPVGSRGTYVINADGSGLTKVADTANVYNRPVWAPDGSRIAMVDRKPETYGVWVINADGSNPMQVFEADRTLQHVAWSPDGNTLAFTWNRGTRDGGLYVVPADGSAEAQVVIESDANYLTRAGSLDWSPDGQYLAVRARPLTPRGVENPILPANEPILTIVQVGSDGTFTILHRVPSMAIGEWYPAWAHNSRTVAAITSKDDGTEQLSAVSVLSGEVVHLLEANRFGSPSWSPDGSRLLVTAYTDEDPGGALRFITLADVGMEWNMSMDMTTDMEAADVQDLRTALSGLWSPSDADSLPAGKALTIGQDSIRVASFTFQRFS